MSVEQNNLNFRHTIMECWLFEMPLRTGRGNNNFNDLLNALQYNIDAGYEVQTLSNDIKQLIADDIIFVWSENNGNPEIIVELIKYQKGYAVVEVGKLQGSLISADTFYANLLKSYKTLIFSGDIISDQGAGIWKKLIANGYAIQAYDTETAKNKRLSVPSDIDIQLYNNTHTRFVLSENVKESMPLWNDFELLRIKASTHNMSPIEILGL
jgi:hypothetical protein